MGNWMEIGKHSPSNRSPITRLPIPRGPMEAGSTRLGSNAKTASGRAPMFRPRARRRGEPVATCRRRRPRRYRGDRSRRSRRWGSMRTRDRLEEHAFRELMAGKSGPTRQEPVHDEDGESGEIIIRNRREPARRVAADSPAPITGVKTRVVRHRQGNRGVKAELRRRLNRGRYGRRRLQELPRQGSRRLGSANQ